MKNKNLIYTLGLVTFLAFNLLTATDSTSTEINNNDLDAKATIETIKDLASKISPEVAAKEYFNYVQSVYENFKADPILNNTTTEKSSIDDFMKSFSSMLQKLSNKETQLEQAIYFSTFPNELIKDINASMMIEMQKYFQNLNAISTEKMQNAQEKSEEELNKIKLEIKEIYKELSKKFFDDNLAALKNVLNKYYNF